MKNTPILKPPKRFILSLIWVAAFAFPSLSHAGIAPIIDNQKLKYHVADLSINDFLEAAEYNQKTDYFSLKTSVQVEMIQILNADGTLEYQIPIHSQLLHIALSDFEKGDYIVNLKFKGKEEFIPTSLTKK